MVVDNEPAARQRLASMLATNEWLECVGRAMDGTTAVQLIDAQRPDVAFLEIQIPHPLGTDVARLVSHRPLLVFTTACTEHAVDAFELGALDYLPKPLSRVRLEQCLLRLRAALGDCLGPAALPFGGSAPGRRLERIFVRQFGTIRPIALSEVYRFEADRDYVVAHQLASRHYLHLPLKRLEQRLDRRRFLRVHRSHIVNLDYVKSFRPYDSTRLSVDLANGERIVASRERSQEIRRLGV